MTVFLALGGGLLSFLSPCVLPLVPAYFGSLAGTEVLQSPQKRFNRGLFFHSLVFVLGFTVIFTALGALAGWAGFSFGSQIIARKIAGYLLIALGIFMLLAIKVPWLNFEKQLKPTTGAATGYFRSFLVGAVFAFAWTPCAGPILGGILALALNSATAWQGAYLLIFFSLGLGIPFLALGIAFGFIMPLLKQIRRFSAAIYIVSGSLLVATGILTLNPSWWTVLWRT